MGESPSLSWHRPASKTSLLVLLLPPQCQSSREKEEEGGSPRISPLVYLEREKRGRMRRGEKHEIGLLRENGVSHKLSTQNVEVAPTFASRKKHFYTVHKQILLRVFITAPPPPPKIYNSIGPSPLPLRKVNGDAAFRPPPLFGHPPRRRYCLLVCAKNQTPAEATLVLGLVVRSFVRAG